MRVSNILPLALASNAAAQSLMEALAAQNASLSALISLIETQPTLLSALGNAKDITILAPNNAALATFLNMSSTSAALMADTGFAQNLLYYHVVNGTYYASNFSSTPAFAPTLLTNATYSNVTGGQVVEAVVENGGVSIYSGARENSTVVTPNLNFTGGTIHIINKVLTVPGKASITAVAANLTDLAGALKTADLINTVDQAKDVTIFAPNNGAFEAIGNLVGNLTAQTLGAILGYHVVVGTVDYSSKITNTTVKSSAGQDLTLRVENGSVFVNQAKVILPDVLIANGVVHVIDAVLNPGNATAMPSGTAGGVAFPGATSMVVSALTSGIAAPTTTGPAASGANGASSSSTGGVPMQTAAVAAAALFGGAAAIMNL